MGPRYLIFVSEPAQGKDSYRSGENEPPRALRYLRARLKVPAQGPRKTGADGELSIEEASLAADVLQKFLDVLERTHRLRSGLLPPE